MEPAAVPAECLEQGVRADDVAADERPRVVQRVVDVGLGREVHDEVGAGDHAVDQVGVADVSVHELDLVGHRRERRTVTRVGQRVKHPYLVLRVVPDGVVHEVRTDEPGPAGNKHPCHGSVSCRYAFATAGKARRSASRQSPIGAIPAVCQAAWPSTL